MGFADEKRSKSNTKPYQNHALHPNELELKRSRVVQARVRARRGKNRNNNYGQKRRMAYAREGDNLVSLAEYEFWSSVGSYSRRLYWNTCTEPRTISPHSRHSRLVMNIRKCTLTTYRTLSRWVPNSLTHKPGSNSKVGQDYEYHYHTGLFHMPSKSQHGQIYAPMPFNPPSYKYSTWSASYRFSTHLPCTNASWWYPKLNQSSESSPTRQLSVMSQAN